MEEREADKTSGQDRSQRQGKVRNGVAAASRHDCQLQRQSNKVVLLVSAAPKFKGSSLPRRTVCTCRLCHEVNLPPPASPASPSISASALRTWAGHTPHLTCCRETRLLVGSSASCFNCRRNNLGALSAVVGVGWRWQQRAAHGSTRRKHKQNKIKHWRSFTELERLGREAVKAWPSLATQVGT